MSLSDIYNNIPAFVIVALVCLSVFAALHNLKLFTDKLWANYFYTLGPLLTGAAIGGTVPYFFSDDMPLGARIVLGMISGLNSGFIIGFLKRYVKAVKENKEQGLDSLIDATVSIIENPVDSFGDTIPPVNKKGD